MRVTLVIGALALGIAGMVAYVRMAPSDPARWHLDPTLARKPTSPNSWLLRAEGGDGQAPVYDMSTQRLARLFDSFVTGQPRIRRLAGSAEEGMITYVARSRIIGYPDYITVRVISLGDGRSTMAIWSRARFGYGDGGVNRRRVENWLRRFQLFLDGGAPSSSGDDGD